MKLKSNNLNPLKKTFLACKGSILYRVCANKKEKRHYQLAKEHY